MKYFISQWLYSSEIDGAIMHDIISDVNVVC